MKPIKKSELAPKCAVDYSPYRKEIQDFLDSGCEAAEVWQDSTVTTNTNRGRYRRVIHQMRVYDQVKEVGKKTGMYLVRKDS